MAAIKADHKRVVLSSILERKDTLFGAFSDKLTKKDKVDAWKEVYSVAISMGAVQSGKDWQYVRDVVWPNMRRATMAKVDNAKKTGTAGGKANKMNELDDLVLNIIGKDSPAVLGLPVEETWVVEGQGENTSFQDASSSHFQEQIPERQTKKKRQEEASDSQEFIALKKLKLQLQVEHLQLANRKLQLEILKEERELGISSLSGANVIEDDNDEAASLNRNIFSSSFSTDV